MKNYLLALAVALAVSACGKSGDTAPAQPYQRTVPPPVTPADFAKQAEPAPAAPRRDVPAPLSPADFHKGVPSPTPGYQRSVPEPLKASDFHKKAAPVQSGEPQK